MTDSLEDFPGTARFQVVRELGRGGMGVVYEVLDTVANEKVALKTLRALTPDSLLRFKQEFRVLQDIEHQHLISLRELIADDAAGWFFTMELVEGPTFLDHVRERPRPSPDSDAPTLEVQLAPTKVGPEVGKRRDFGTVDEALLRVAMGQLVRGLIALHAAGKIHRDIKPSNVLIDSADGRGRVVVLDFGLAVEHAREPQINAMAREEAETQSIVGTVDYMSPEQAAGQPLGPESDWYSVGVMLFEALTGDVPFTGGPIDVLFAKQRGEAKTARSLVPSIPADLDALCTDLLRFAPSARPTGFEILDRLGGRGVAPERVSSVSGGVKNFIGRGEELERLHYAFEESRLGRGGSVYVVGESGVGKSALVRRFLEEARSECSDLILLTGRCYERESVPYKAMDNVIDALSQYLVKRNSREVAQLLPPNAPLLAEVFPVLSRVPAVVEAPTPPHQILDPIERRLRVFGALRELFISLAKQHPLMIVVDDLQWSDDDSRALLAELLRQSDAAPILLLATIRPTTSDINTLLIGLPTPLDRIDLDRLPFDQALHLAEQIARTVAPGMMLPLPQLVEEAGGHPLFLDELIRFSATSSASTTRPVQLEDALRARIEALETESRHLLSLLAIAGRPILQITASQATALGAGFAKQVGLLRVAHLIRTNGMRGTDRIETFHDRVRAAALAVIPPEGRHELHRKLAVAFETSGHIDPEPQMIHWIEAGDQARAAIYARQAAQQAERALAFDRAARLYRKSIELSREEGATLHELQIGLGDALSNAGRGAEAAAAYLRAAESGSVTVALDLRRRAAEALLRSGHITEGVEVVRSVLKAVGMSLPSTMTGALASVGFQRVKLRLRGLKFKKRAEQAVSPVDLTRVDVCWAVGTGLAFVDTIRGADFQTRNLILALQTGEPVRIARGLCLEAIYSALGGRKSGKRTDLLLTMADELSCEAQQARLVGLQRMAFGTCRFLEGSFAEAYRVLSAAETIFRDQCSGVSWELASTQPFLLFSQYFLGELKAFAVRVAQLETSAQERGDLYSLTNLRTEFVPLVALFRGQPEIAMESVEKAMRNWTNEGIHLEHFWEMHSSAQIELYQGAAEQAYDRILRRWGDLKKVLLMDIEQIRIECTYLRGRSALSAAGENPRRRSELLAAGERDAKSLLAERAKWAHPLAHMLLSSAAGFRGDSDEALKHCISAETKFAEVDLHMHVASAGWRRGELTSGEQGTLQIAKSRAWFLDQDVARPERMVAMLTPPVISPVTN